jgi:hypothetical protein
VEGVHPLDGHGIWLLLWFAVFLPVPLVGEGGAVALIPPQISLIFF